MLIVASLQIRLEGPNVVSPVPIGKSLATVSSPSIYKRVSHLAEIASQNQTGCKAACIVCLTSLFFSSYKFSLDYTRFINS